MTTDNTQLVAQFIEHYKSLSESEQFKLGGLFNKETGGKLSPYNSPNPVAVGVLKIQDGDKIKLLGIVRGIAPKIGEIAFPGGFQNTLENGKIAAAREIKEETGLDTNPEDYSIMDAKMSPTNNELIFYVNKNVYPKEILETLFCAPDAKGVIEVTGYVLIDRDTPMAFPLHREIATHVLADANAIENQPTPRLKM